jgi:hypothetical protein
MAVMLAVAEHRLGTATKPPRSRFPQITPARKLATLQGAHGGFCGVCRGRAAEPQLGCLKVSTRKVGEDLERWAERDLHATRQRLSKRVIAMPDTPGSSVGSVTAALLYGAIRRLPAMRLQYGRY